MLPAALLTLRYAQDQAPIGLTKTKPSRASSSIGRWNTLTGHDPCLRDLRVKIIPKSDGSILGVMIVFARVTCFEMIEKVVLAMARQSASSLTLSRAFLAFMALMTLICAAVLVFSVHRITQQMTERMLAWAIEGRSQAAVDAFQRDLAQDWRLLAAVAAITPKQPDASLRPALDLAASVADQDETSWIGFAGVDGKVIAATGGVLEGVDVSQRPWFQAGLTRPFAGDVHEATLLAKILKPLSDDPVRFIDYARPILSNSGQPIGVIGMHINFDWATRRLKEIAASLHIDMLLVSADGKIILSTTDKVPVRPTIAAFELAKMGATGSILATWPDGHRYFSTVRPVKAAEGVPSFGWRLISRIDASALGSINGNLGRSVAGVAGALVAILVVMTAWFVRAFVQPFGKLAATAVAIADGEDAFPREYSRLRELRQFSTALARLQAQKSDSSASGRG